MPSVQQPLHSHMIIQVCDSFFQDSTGNVTVFSMHPLLYCLSSHACIVEC